VTRLGHSVAFRLFVVTFVVIMLFLGVLLAALAGSFASFYERRQIKDIASQMNLIRDRYAAERRPSFAAGTYPSYFFRFENDYYAQTSLLTLDDGKVLFRRESRAKPNGSEDDSLNFGLLPDPFYFFPQSGPDEQMQKLRLALTEWMQDRQAVDQVMKDRKTLVYRSTGAGTADYGNDQLIAVAPIDTDGHGGGTVLFAVSSLQPVIGASRVIRDFSWYAFGVAFVLVPVLSLLYAGLLTKPLRSLNGLARRLASLDFSVRARWRRKDEIGELARTYDFLADNLQGALAELREANDKLREDIEREKALERMRRDFVAGVSHELKTPLSLIGGYAEGLQDDVKDGTKRERYAAVILEETRHMAAIVGDMLDLSQLESGQYRLKRERFDAAELLREAADRAEALGQTRGVKADLILAVEGTDAIEVEADRLRIGQVLTNLVTNAVRHTPDGRRITLEACRDGSVWQFTVNNEGEPIPEQELPRIWGQFYRIDKARNRESGGTGIGLSIVRQILELHGSRYDARNERGGVAFRFTLPTAGR